MKFQAKAIMSIEELNQAQIEHKNGWVTGSLVDGQYIVGDVIEIIECSITPEFFVRINPKTVSPFVSNDDPTSKNKAFNLKFKEDEVFKDSYVIVDQSDIPFLWINKETGAVSFGGKYFHLYREQRLVETLDEFAEIANDFVKKMSGEQSGFIEQFEKALKAKRYLEFEFFKVDPWDLE